MPSVRTSALKLFDATAGALACRLAGRLNYWAGREIHLEPVQPERVRRILVIRPGGMGDMILLLPVLQALRAACPNAAIELVCERRNREIAALAGCADRVLLYDANPTAFLSRLVRTRYDLAIDTEQFHHFSALFAWLSGAPLRVGFSINPVRNPLYTHLVHYLCNGPEPEQFAALLRPLGMGPVAPVSGCLAGRVSADAGSADHGAQPELIVHPGSSVPYKQWGEARLAELLERMVRRHGCRITFVGTPDESILVQRILARARLAPGEARSMVDHTPLARTASLIRGGSAFLGGDSGLAHLAAAIGVPSVVIFGPSDERKWGPRGDAHRVVTANVPCRPCCMFGYHKPCHTIACLQRVPVERVETALVEVLGRPAAVATHNPPEV